MWFATDDFIKVAEQLFPESQSPYGAMWFATGIAVLRENAPVVDGSQSPYGAM